MTMPRRPKLNVPPPPVQSVPPEPASRGRGVLRSVLTILAAFVGICVALGIGLRIVRVVAF